MVENKRKLKIEYTNDIGNTTKIETTLSCSSLDSMEEHINSFLKLCGFGGYEKDRVMLISVTDGEYDDLMNYLEDLRAEKDNMPHWILESNAIEPNPLFKVFHCSKCDGINPQLSQYCPHCGARMDKGEKENDGNN